MKKKILVLCTVMMCFLIAAVSWSASAVLLGDVDQNGRVTAADARRTLRVAANLDQFSPEEKAIADVDFNGSITAGDARRILRVAAQLDVFQDPELTSSSDDETTTEKAAVSTKPVAEETTLPSTEPSKPTSTKPSTDEKTTAAPTTTEPSATEPAAEETTSDSPVTTEPTATEPADEETTTDPPVTTEPTATEPSDEETTPLPPTTEPSSTEPGSEETTGVPPTTTEPVAEETTTEEPATTPSEPEVPTGEAEPMDVAIIRSGTYEMVIASTIEDETMQMMLVKDQGNLCIRILGDDALNGTYILVVDDKLYVAVSLNPENDSKLLLSEESLRALLGDAASGTLDDMKNVMYLLAELLPDELGQPTELTEDGQAYYVYDYEAEGTHRQLYVTKQGQLKKIVIDSVDGSLQQVFTVDSVSGTLSEPYFALEDESASES